MRNHLHRKRIRDEFLEHSNKRRKLLDVGEKHTPETPVLKPAPPRSPFMTFAIQCFWSLMERHDDWTEQDVMDTLIGVWCQAEETSSTIWKRFMNQYVGDTVKYERDLARFWKQELMKDKTFAKDVLDEFYRMRYSRNYYTSSDEEGEYIDSSSD